MIQCQPAANHSCCCCSAAMAPAVRCTPQSQIAFAAAIPRRTFAKLNTKASRSPLLMCALRLPPSRSEPGWRRMETSQPGQTTIPASPVQQHPYNTAAQQSFGASAAAALLAALLARLQRIGLVCGCGDSRPKHDRAGPVLTVWLDVVDAQPGAEFEVHVGALVLRQRPGALGTPRSE